MRIAFLIVATIVNCYWYIPLCNSLGQTGSTVLWVVGFVVYSFVLHDEGVEVPTACVVGAFWWLLLSFFISDCIWETLECYIPCLRRKQNGREVLDRSSSSSDGTADL